MGAGPPSGHEWRLASTEPEAWRWLPNLLVARSAGERYRASQRALLAKLNVFLRETEGQRWTSGWQRWLAFLLWNLQRSPAVNRVTTCTQWMQRLLPVVASSSEWALGRQERDLVLNALGQLQLHRPPPQLRNVQVETREAEAAACSLRDDAWFAVLLMTRAGARRADAARWASGWTTVRIVKKGAGGGGFADIQPTVEKSDLTGRRPVPESIVLRLESARELERASRAVAKAQRGSSIGAEEAFRGWSAWLSAFLHSHAIRDVRALRRDTAARTLAHPGATRRAVARVLRHDPGGRNPDRYAGARYSDGQLWTVAKLTAGLRARAAREKMESDEDE
jgi:hypothetical protein